MAAHGKRKGKSAAGKPAGGKAEAKKRVIWLIFTDVIIVVLAAACFLTLRRDRNLNDKEPDVPETEASAATGAVKWFDADAGDELDWKGAQEYSVPEFPDVTFRVTEAVLLEAVTEKEATELYSGMPVWSVYFCDLNGDGKPELCSGASYGSGMIDDRIEAYDFAAGQLYELEDRGNYDYRLREQDGVLIAEKRTYMEPELLASGPLVLRDDRLQMEETNGN